MLEDRRRTFAVTGILLLVIGVFLPVFEITLFGQSTTIDYFRDGDGDGLFVLILAAVAAFLLYIKLFHWLRYAGIGAIIIMVITLFDYFNNKSQIREEYSSDDSNFFSQVMSQMADNSVTLEWGWIILFVGASMLIYASYLTPTAQESPPQIET
jgi:hypothetical protein